MTEIKDETIYLHEKILASPVLVGCLSFLFMAVLNFSCLENPPYWDDILGLHNQAVWLAKHKFDIAGLWRSGPYMAGGSNVYPFGIMPYFYGILYSIFAADTVHILGHLFNMSCLALAFGTSYSILRKFEITPYLALLWCVAAVSEPVMSGRIVALGQECPMLCGAVLSIYFLVDKKYWKGLLFIFFSMLCKTTPGILSIAFIVWLVLDIISAKNNWKERLKECIPYLFGAVFLVILFFFMGFFMVDEKMHGSRILFHRCFINLKYQLPVLLPIQFGALILIGFIAVLNFKSLFGASEKSRISLLLIIFIGGFWSAYALYYNSLARYTAFIVFPMYIFIAINTGFKKKHLAVLPAFVLLLAGLANSNGNFYPRLRPWDLRSGETLERSREYLNDLWGNQAACRLLETKYFDRSIVVKWPFLQMLTVPEMGYVTKALPNVYAACLPAKYVKAKTYRDNVKMPDNTLYVFSFNTFELWRQFGPSLALNRGEKCKVIYKNQLKGGWFIIYEKKPE